MTGAVSESGPPAGASGRVARRLDELFDESYDSIVRSVTIRTGSRSVAEDVAGATFADAARAYASGIAVDEAWVRMVARRRLIDHWRSNERHRRRVRRLAESRLVQNPSPGSDDVTTDRVRRALDLLPDRQRSALTLRYLDGHSVAEIAEALDVSYRAAESALARARRSFTAAWEEDR